MIVEKTVSFMLVKKSGVVAEKATLKEVKEISEAVTGRWQIYKHTRTLSLVADSSTTKTKEKSKS